MRLYPLELLERGGHHRGAVREARLQTSELIRRQQSCAIRSERRNRLLQRRKRVPRQLRVEWCTAYRRIYHSRRQREL